MRWLPEIFVVRTKSEGLKLALLENLLHGGLLGVGQIQRLSQGLDVIVDCRTPPGCSAREFVAASCFAALRLLVGGRMPALAWRPPLVGLDRATECPAKTTFKKSTATQNSNAINRFCRAYAPVYCRLVNRESPANALKQSFDANTLVGLIPRPWPALEPLYHSRCRALNPSASCA